MNKIKYTDNGFIMDGKHYIAIEHYDKLKQALEVAKEGLENIEKKCEECGDDTILDISIMDITGNTLTKINKLTGE